MALKQIVRSKGKVKLSVYSIVCNMIPSHAIIDMKLSRVIFQFNTSSNRYTYSVYEISNVM